MKLHRLSVTNYRGIAHREIQFPDRGVVVVSGANEVGKTSMVEALDLLIESKDRSTKKDVKLVKPTHADVGSEVEAEISCGPYRFVYRKRFHKRAETHLTIVTPRREQLSGDEAHQRVLEMLGQSMDMALWKAQRVLQAAGAGATDLSASDALTRALDMAAGESVALSGSEPDLVERIDAEYAKYFTATGRPTGEWAKAIARLSAAQESLSVAVAAVNEVEQQVRLHDELTAELALIMSDRTTLGRKLFSLQQAVSAVSALTQQRDNAAVVVEAAEEQSKSAVFRCIERQQLIGEIETRRRGAAEIAKQLEVADHAQALARQKAETAEAATQSATETLDALRADLSRARDILERAVARDEVDALAGRVSRIDTTARQLATRRDELATMTIDIEAIAALEEARRAVDLAEAASVAAAAQVEIEAIGGLVLEIDGQRIELESTHRWQGAVSESIEITIPEVATARIIPGDGAADLRQRAQARRLQLAEALAAVQAQSLEEARQQHRQRAEIVADCDRLSALLDGLTGNDSPDILRDKLTRLQALAPEENGLWDAIEPDEARVVVSRLVAQVDDAQQTESINRQSLRVAACELAEKNSEATVLREKYSARAEEYAAAEQRLNRARQEMSDELLDQRRTEAQNAADKTARRLADLIAQLTALQPESVTAELAEVSARVGALDARRETLREQLRDNTVRLEVFGRQGRKDQLDAAETEVEYAKTEFAGMGAKARAAELLRSVMLRHRDGMRLRYVDPFARELERLGRIVFGPTFQVDVDSDLTIRSRTLDGRTVPYESLSGGAKEQLGIIARLASAALVAPEDAVPVIIDDALGFTDVDRLVKMGAVFDAVGNQSQLIVLTCNPDRYQGVTCAQRISLCVDA